MRTRFSPILICGSATLFAACGDINVANSGGGGSDVTTGDSVTGDAASDGSDGGDGDVTIGEDVSEDDVTAAEDVESPDDVPVVAEDVVTSDDVPGRTDIEFPLDVDQDAVTDVDSPDVTIADVDHPDAGGPDVDWSDVDPGDVDPADVAPADVDPGDVDPADVDPADVQAPGPHIGEPCELYDQAWCSDEAVPTLSCKYIEGQWIWTEYDENGLPCFCDPGSSPGPAACAVPGFVGIDQSGRERRAPSLRALRRAARLG